MGTARDVRGTPARAHSKAMWRSLQSRNSTTPPQLPPQPSRKCRPKQHQRTAGGPPPTYGTAPSPHGQCGSLGVSGRPRCGPSCPGGSGLAAPAQPD
eukprot:10289604-Alexandrium_andersonii.AAC.1